MWHPRRLSGSSGASRLDCASSSGAVHRQPLRFLCPCLVKTSTSLGPAPVYATKLVEMAEVGSPILAGPAMRVVACCGRSSFCGGSTCSRDCGALHFPLCRAWRCDGLWLQFSLVYVPAMYTALLPVLSPRASKRAIFVDPFRVISFFLRPLVEVTPSSPRQPVHSRDIERARVSRFQAVVSHCFKMHEGIRERMTQAVSRPMGSPPTNAPLHRSLCRRPGCSVPVHPECSTSYCNLHCLVVNPRSPRLLCCAQLNARRLWCADGTVHASFRGLSAFLLRRSIAVVCIQETHAPAFAALPNDQPYRYDGPCDSGGSEAGFLFHETVTVTSTMAYPLLGRIGGVCQAHSTDTPCHSHCSLRRR